MTVPWPCPLTVEEYASGGRGVEVPRPDCPGCGRPMTFEGWYPRLVGILPTTWRIFIRRAVCNRCGKGHALLADFVTRGRLDHIEVIGTGVVAGVAPSGRERAPSPADGVPASTRRSWRACFTSRAEVLAAGFRALCVSYDGELPRELDPPTGPPALVAVVSLGAAWDAARRRCAAAGRAMVAPWGFANLICGGALLATRVNLRWEVIGMGGAVPRGRSLPP
jgi:hypothetical protein